jgi:crotonobetainyl-CoA:carnitine CoA-transferase CaiB-like acyl-CoA transferase
MLWIICSFRCRQTKAAPRLGEDTEETLRQIAGYSKEKIDELRRERVI